MLNKKGQTSTELLIIIGAGLLIIMGIMVTMQDGIVSAKLQNHDANTQALFDYIKEEITLAESSPYEYNSSFLVPSTIQSGATINDISIHHSGFPNAPVDLTIEIDNIEYVRYYYNISDTSDICTGSNTIYKPTNQRFIEIKCKI